MFLATVMVLQCRHQCGVTLQCTLTPPALQFLLQGLPVQGDRADVQVELLLQTLDVLAMPAIMMMTLTAFGLELRELLQYKFWSDPGRTDRMDGFE